MKIVVLEQIEMSAEQKVRLEKCGQIEYYDYNDSTPAQIICKAAEGADITVVNWIDPSDFILSMKAPSLIALMSTGYAWIQHREQARKNGCLIANIPDFATEAVAEHIVGLILSSSKKITIGDREIRGGLKRRGTLRGFELCNKKVGIIGLGKIGKRVADILQGGFRMEIITYNRTPKNNLNIKDVDLDILLSESDIVCVTCSLTPEAKNMIDCNKLRLLRQDAIVVGTTWGVIKTTDIPNFMNNDRPDVFFGFDTAIEGEDINLKQNLLSQQNITLTPHTAFDTNESLIRQVDTCIANIEAFIAGKEQNIIN